MRCQSNFPLLSHYWPSCWFWNSSVIGRLIRFSAISSYLGVKPLLLARLCLFQNKMVVRHGKERMTVQFFPLSFRRICYKSRRNYTKHLYAHYWLEDGLEQIPLTPLSPISAEAEDPKETGRAVAASQSGKMSVAIPQFLVSPMLVEGWLIFDGTNCTC